MLLRVFVATISVVSVVLLSTGCSPSDAAGDLEGTEWTLVTWSEPDVDPAQFGITAQFTDGQIGGRSAVNSYGGPYSATRDGGFVVGDIASTLMAGPEPAMEAERTYFELLRRVDAYELSDDELTLLVEGGEENLGFVPTR